MTIRDLTLQDLNLADVNASLDYLSQRQLSDWPGTLPDSSIAYANEAANKVLAGPASGNPATPSFRVLASGDVPNLDASKITTGQLALARGGTHADLSATGGASQVLKQISAGANITVGQLAASDLSNGTTGSGGGVVLATSPTITTPLIGGTVPSYNSISTVKNGLPSEYAFDTRSAQTANLTAITLYAVPATAAFAYRVSACLTTSTAGSAGSTVTLNVSWTDASSVARAHAGVCVFNGAAGCDLTSSTGTATGVCVLTNVKASTNITFTTSGTYNGGAAYNLQIVLEAL